MYTLYIVKIRTRFLLFGNKIVKLKNNTNKFGLATVLPTVASVTTMLKYYILSGSFKKRPLHPKLLEGSLSNHNIDGVQTSALEFGDICFYLYRLDYMITHFPFSAHGLFFLSGACISGSFFSFSSTYSLIL